MTRYHLYLLVGVLITMFILSGCDNTSEEPQTSNYQELQTSASDIYGYPDGELQNTYIFVNSKLYVYKGVCKDGGEDQREFYYPDYEYIGEVSKISNIELPDEEFEASRTEIGTKVFGKDDEIILYTNTGRTMEMELSDAQ